MKINNKKGLEKHNFFIKVVRIISVPIMNNIPSSILQKMMHKSSKDASTVANTGGSTMALEVMYTRYHRKLFSRGIMQGLADLFWHHVISQPKALRNRLAIVEEIVESRLESLIEKDHKEIRILNIGGGSSRALVHTIDRLRKDNREFSPEITNIDKDARAIEVGKKIATDFNLSSVFKWINDDARNLDSLIKPGSMDVVEMVGLMDYFDDERAHKVLSGIYNCLEDGGLFIVANVHFNSEMKFVERTGWPAMYYRNPEDIKRIIKNAGFNKNINFIMEPMKVHTIAAVEK